MFGNKHRTQEQALNIFSKDTMGTLAAKSLNKKQAPQLGFGCTLCNGIECDTGFWKYQLVSNIQLGSSPPALNETDMCGNTILEDSQCYLTLVATTTTGAQRFKGPNGGTV